MTRSVERLSSWFGGRRNTTFRRRPVLEATRWSVIYSKHHGLISLALAAGFRLLVPDPTATGLPLPALLAYAVAIGVFVDLDHFLVERLVTGEWRALGRGIERPRRFVLDQSALFGEDSLTPLDRLLSHVVIIGIAVPATWFLAPSLGLLTAIVLYGHVLADLVWDVYRHRVAEDSPHVDELD